MIDNPFLIVNPKNLFSQKELYEMAGIMDSLSVEYNVTLILTAPFTELSNLRKKTNNILIASQHVDNVVGPGMGKVSVKNLHEINVDIAVINHAENPLYFDEISNIIKQCNEYNIHSLVCCNSLSEAKAMAFLNPTIILCEPTELIGSGKTSDLSYVKETNKIIKSVNPNILVEQGAGIKKAEDVYRIIKAGSDGAGATSAFVDSEDRELLLRNMILALKRGIRERRSQSDN
ncbi:MAG: triose-phosphate isomerase [Clostridiaceae bacterium]|nr:triose-phosphate isomerase [Clostridiaceae bacterium]